MSAGTLRVLVVDGYADAADSLALLLRLYGYECHVAYSGPTALTVALTVQPDVVLTELFLPGHDGFEVARLLRGQSVLVALTTNGQARDRWRARQAGFASVFLKPADPEGLIQLLKVVEHGLLTPQ